MLIAQVPEHRRGCDYGDAVTGVFVYGQVSVAVGSQVNEFAVLHVKLRLRQPLLVLVDARPHLSHVFVEVLLLGGRHQWPPGSSLAPVVEVVDRQFQGEGPQFPRLGEPAVIDDPDALVGVQVGQVLPATLEGAGGHDADLPGSGLQTADRRRQRGSGSRTVVVGGDQDAHAHNRRVIGPG